MPHFFVNRYTSGLSSVTNTYPSSEIPKSQIGGEGFYLFNFIKVFRNADNLLSVFQNSLEIDQNLEDEITYLFDLGNAGVTILRPFVDAIDRYPHFDFLALFQL